MDLIDYRDSRPMYEQIVQRYKMLIVSGTIAQDSQMPSVRKLAMELSANPNTVQRAYAELERDGFLYSVKGRGIFVSGGAGLREKEKSVFVARLRKLLSEAKACGISEEELFEGVHNDKD